MQVVIDIIEIFDFPGDLRFRVKKGLKGNDLSVGSVEADRDWEVASVVVFLKNGGFLVAGNCVKGRINGREAYEASVKMPVLWSLGRRRVFLGASEETSLVNGFTFRGLGGKGLLPPVPANLAVMFRSWLRSLRCGECEENFWADFLASGAGSISSLNRKFRNW